jgi:hypothetical protein
MSLQSIILRVQSFFHYLFETFTMRTKPKYMPLHEEEETLYLTESMTIER